MFPRIGYSRRHFFAAATSGLALSAMPRWWLAEAEAQTAKPAVAADGPGIALVGYGSRAMANGKDAARFGPVVAVCDVDEDRLGVAKAAFPKAQLYRDFRDVLQRKDVGVVVCSTVDHWHALVSLATMRAGKDVYCEKPLTLTVEEGQRLVRVARETGRVFQTGSQQRSSGRFRLACELVQSGRLGKLKQITVGLPDGLRGGPFQSTLPPATLDWDRWQGQCVAMNYVPERQKEFRMWLDYSGGKMTDWGAHHLDIVQWALGMDRSGPIHVHGQSLQPPKPGGYTTASQFHVEYQYANGVPVVCRSYDPGAIPTGVKFEGANGWIYVAREKLTASDPALLETPLPSSAHRLEVSEDHMGNFFDCVRSRRQPICDAEIGHRSATVCHLGVISLRLRRALDWDPVQERFVNDPDANQWLAREQRRPWTYDMC